MGIGLLMGQDVVTRFVRVKVPASRREREEAHYIIYNALHTRYEAL